MFENWLLLEFGIHTNYFNQIKQNNQSFTLMLIQKKYFLRDQGKEGERMIQTDLSSLK